MRIIARLRKAVIMPSKPLQLVFDAETADLANDDALMELAGLNDETNCILTITPMQSNLPFDDVKVEVARLR